MRISNFCSTLDPSRGGVANGVFLTASNLTDYGIESQVLSFGNLRSKLVTHLTIQQKMNRIGVIYNFTLARFANDYGIGSLKGLKQKLNSMPKPNIVVLHQIYTLSTFFGYHYAKNNQIPFVVFPHGSLTKYHEADSKLIKTLAKWLFISKVLRESNAIIVTCASEKNDLNATFQKKAIILPYGANLNYAFNDVMVKSLSGRQQNRILFSGRFDKKKNLQVVLKSMPLMLNIFPDLVLDIAGSGSKKEIANIENLILELKLEKSVKLYGWIDKLKMQELFASTRLLVLPSENENFGLVVSEALSAGIPCVVSKFVGTADIIAKHHAGVVINELTPASVAEGILTVLQGDRIKYRKSALEAVEISLNWSEISFQWKGLIKSLS